MTIVSAPSRDADLAQWLSFLERVHPTEIELGLDRVRRVAQALGWAPSARIITVGGTNGKGSVCAMLEAMLVSAGYSTGVYASPHLVRYNERIRVNGHQVADDVLVSAFARIEAARDGISLTYFEYSTLAALLIFSEQDVDVAVLEVGLGGRLDAVNIADADCAVITSVALDHQAYLGDTREAIGYEKAHIFRAGKPVICADPQPPRSLIDYAHEIGADLWQYGRDFSYVADAMQWAYRGRDQNLGGLAYPALRGSNQVLNATAALAALEALRPDIAVPAQAVRRGLLHAVLPGRLQILAGQPVIVLDVAHNPHAAAALAQNLHNMPLAGKTWAVLGMLDDKDAAGVLAPLLPYVHHWMCAGLTGARGQSGEDLASRVCRALDAAESRQPPLSEAVPNPPQHSEHGSGHRTDQPDQPDQGGITDPALAGKRPTVRPAVASPSQPRDATITVFDNPVSAFLRAREQASVNDRILVFGSFATVGPVLGELEQSR